MIDIIEDDDMNKDKKMTWINRNIWLEKIDIIEEEDGHKKNEENMIRENA